jgi:inosose dehydratase
VDGAVNVRLATGPVSWGVDFADSPHNPPWEHVLDEIARSGFRFIELGPIGYLPEDPAVLRAELERRGLGVGGSFVFEPLHDPERLPEVLAVTRRTCRAIAGAGGGHLVIIDLVAPERIRTAGRSADARRLGPDEWAALADGVRAVATIARDEFGLRPVFHPHVASYVEFEDEIERLLATLPADVVELCLDTGHCHYAGIDAVSFYEAHAERIPYLHLKDVDPDARTHAVEDGLDFWQAITADVFCPVGLGSVPFPALARALARHDFDGWATVEQDRDPRKAGHPLLDAVSSRRYLENAGFAAPSPATKASHP